MNKIEDEEIGTCARVEISQDANNTDQKVKWSLKVHKTYKLCGKHFFQFSFFSSFYSGSFLQIFPFLLPENERYNHKLIKIIHFSIASKIFLTLPSFRLLSVIA